MKSNNNFRGPAPKADREDALRKAVKLDPIKKSGKEKRTYTNFEDEEQDDWGDYKKRESVLDYFGDEEEDEP